MGDMQGKTRAQITSRANIEPIERFVGRALDWWDIEIMPLLSTRQAGEEPLHILAVSHGAFIAQFVNSGLIQTRGFNSDGDITSGRRVYNTSISVIEVQEDGMGFIPMYADIKHLLRRGAEDNADLEESSKAGGTTS